MIGVQGLGTGCWWLGLQVWGLGVGVRAVFLDPRESPRLRAKSLISTASQEFFFFFLITIKPRLE